VITIGIKSLNEEEKIAQALTGALKAVEPFAGGVILADSGSADRTIEIARRFPVRILQLADPADKCCGAGAQLAFQYVDTEFFYIQDGDMVLNPAFLASALTYLRSRPDVAGVGGHVVERELASEEFQIRAATLQAETHRRPGLVDRLDGGGLYRVAAIRQVGYFADRNLHAFEEFELAARLGAAGWRLARIDIPAADHYGHDMGGYRLLWRRYKSGYAMGSGEVLHSALGKKHIGFVLGHLRHLRHSFLVIAWWVLLLAAAWREPWAAVGLFVIPLLLLWFRRGRLRLAIYSLAYWNIGAVGLIKGIVRRRVSPDRALDAVDLSHPQSHMERVS
jgi:GT2 family glycosyltransferase